MLHLALRAVEIFLLWLLLIAIPLGLYLGPRLRSNSRRYTKTTRSPR